MGAFPFFKDVSLSLFETYQQVCGGIPPHSDLSFTNLFAWSGNRAITYTKLHDNLIFSCTDYIDGRKFFALLGNNSLPETTQILSDFSRTSLGYVDIRYMSEDGLQQLESNGYVQYYDDPSSQDYMLSTAQLASLTGSAHKHTRELVNRFMRDFGSSATIVHTKLSSVKLSEIVDVFCRREKTKLDGDSERELDAIRKIYQFADELDINCSLVSVANEIQAFIIYDSFRNDTILAHFWKANVDEYRGIYQYLLHGLSEYLERTGITQINFEQDLGIPSLRTAKQYLRPTHYIKKYSISHFIPYQMPAYETPAVRPVRQTLQPSLLY